MEKRFQNVSNAGHETENSVYLTLALRYFYIYQEIMVNVLVSSFCFIWISMSWVYSYYKYFTLSVQGSTLKSESGVYRRQIMTSKIGPRAERDKNHCYVFWCRKINIVDT